MKPVPLKLTKALKRYRHDQDKVISPEETVRRFKERLAEHDLDILKDIVRIDNGRLGIPVYFSICGTLASETIGNYKQMGKGATPEQAQASAVMELAERFSLFSFVQSQDPFVIAPQESLTEPSLDFEQIVRSVGNADEDPAPLERFFRELPQKWTWAYDLTRAENVLMPFDWFWNINEFNGSSAGNGVEEALCQGICEIVERHVCAVISREHMPVPAIDQQTINDPVALELLSKHRNAGVNIHLSDFTLDMGIPSIGALAWDPSTFPEKSEIVWTAGTTPSAAKALCRALTEVAQLAGDFNSSGNYVASGLPKFGNLEAAAYVTQPGNRVTLADLPDIGDDDIKVEVERCVAALSRRNMHVFTIDVTHPLLGIPAFYTIVPGAHFRERAAHGSVGMMMAKIITQTYPAALALSNLGQLKKSIGPQYYLEFYRGQILLEQGDYQTASSHLADALELGPPAEDHATILTYAGLCHKETADYDQALIHLEKAHHIDPERTDTLNLMGFCHFKLKAHDRAIDCFKKLIALDPSSAIDYANIGANYRAMGERTKAIEYYQLALSLDADIDFARMHLAELTGDGE